MRKIMMTLAAFLCCIMVVGAQGFVSITETAEMGVIAIQVGKQGSILVRL